MNPTVAMSKERLIILMANADVVCNLCGSTKNAFVFNLRDWRIYIPGHWALYQCQNCGVKFIYPQPDWKQLSSHYPKTYHAYLQPGAKGPRKWLLNYGLKRRVRIAIDHEPTSGTLLDIGCASGEFLEYFVKHTNWKGIGIEPIEHAAELAQKKGLTVIKGTLNDANFESSFFDVITLWDVLEHLPNPASSLKECARLLKPSGKLIIKVPDSGGLEAEKFMEYWSGYEAPQHLFGFTKRSLTLFLNKISFASFRYFQVGSDQSCYLNSIANTLSARNKVKLAKQITGLSRIKIFSIFIGLTRHLGFTSSITLSARKQG